MGLLVSRFRKKNTIQILDDLEKKIRSIEQHGHSTEQRRRRIIGVLMVFSIGIYVLAAMFFYLYFRKNSWRDVLFYAMPLLVFPVVIILLRLVLSKYYEWKLERNKSKLIDMRAEKKKILEEVMDKETYKYAKEILDKFGDSKEIVPLSMEPRTPAKSLTPVLATPVNLRQRQVTPVAKPGAVSSMPMLKTMGNPFEESPMMMTPSKNVQLPRPVLSVGSGPFDRLVDYLVGEGPGSRYALICSQCCGHNGMALPEEFDFLSYRCAYCKHFNAAKKQKPRAPPLTSTPKHTPFMTSRMIEAPSSVDNTDSTEEKNSDKDSEPEEMEVEHTPTKCDNGKISDS